MEKLIEEKYLVFDMFANIGMSWWVSGVVFCGTILAGCWIKRETIICIPYFHLFCTTVSVFYISIVFFGFFMSYHTARLGADIASLLIAAGHPDPTSRTEFACITYGYIIGTSSFILISLCWFILWRILADLRRTAGHGQEKALKTGKSVGRTGNGSTGKGVTTGKGVSNRTRKK